MLNPFVPFAVEVIADSSGEWCGNGMRFNTAAEAKDYAIGLFYRWTAVRDYRIVEYELRGWLAPAKKVAMAKCFHCHELKVDVRMRVDPYDHEIKGDNTQRPLCDLCVSRSADEV